MKRTSKLIFSLCLTACCALSATALTSCGEDTPEYYTAQTAFTKAQELGFTGSLADFILFFADGNSEGVQIKSVELINGELNVTLADGTVKNYGDVRDNKHTVTFDTDGGSAVESQLIADGKKITKPQDPVKESYVFDGWYFGEEEWSFAGFAVTEDVTLKAKWKDAVYNITYKLDGGLSGNPATYTRTSGFTLSAPSKTGYDFVGWSGTGINGVTAEVSVSGEVGDREYTAHYSAKQFTVGFNGLGVSGIPSRTVTYDGFYGELPTPQQREGYTFVGWEAYGELITPTTTVKIIRDGYLTARWKGITYNITYELEGGVANNPTTYEYGTYLSIENPTKTGYDFVGWTGTGITYPDENLYLYETQGDKVYTANWSAKYLNVTTEEGAYAYVKTVRYDGVYGDVPNPPNKDGYDFIGWFTAVEGGQQITPTTLVKTETDHKLYARWSQPIAYGITYNLNGGVATNPESYTILDEITLNNPTKEGYMFTGWSGTDIIGEQVCVKFNLSTGDREYTANFIKIQASAEAPLDNDGKVTLARGTENYEHANPYTNWNYATLKLSLTDALIINFTGQNVPNIVMLSDTEGGQAYAPNLKGYAFIAGQFGFNKNGTQYGPARFLASGPNRAAIDESGLFGRNDSSGENLVSSSGNYKDKISYGDYLPNASYQISVTHAKTQDGIAINYEVFNVTNDNTLIRRVTVNATDDYAKALYSNGNEQYYAMLYGNGLSDITFTAKVPNKINQNGYAYLPRGTEDYHTATAYTDWNYVSVQMGQAQTLTVTFKGKNAPNVVLLSDTEGGQAYAPDLNGYAFICAQTNFIGQFTFIASGPNRAEIDSNGFFGRNDAKDNTIVPSKGTSYDSIAYADYIDSHEYELVITTVKSANGVTVSYAVYDLTENRELRTIVKELKDDYAKGLFVSGDEKYYIMLYGNALQDTTFKIQLTQNQ